MEGGLSASHVEDPGAAAGNLYTGEVYTDEVLMKAGADDIQEVNVANVQLVS